MEFEELKNTWSTLDKRLKKQETLKESILKEMLHTKSDKALSKLMSGEIIGAIIVLLMTPVIVYSFYLPINIFEYKTFMILMFIFCVLILFWQCYKTYNLIKIDFEKPISINIQYTNRYNILIRKEKTGMMFFIPFLVISCFYLYARLNVNILLYVFLACLFISSIFITVWSYKKLYDKNIKSILNSLEELKELEEEDIE